MAKKAIETPSVTKPLSTNGDARTVHPSKKACCTPHPRANEGYKAVGSKSKSGGDGSELVRPTANPEKGYDRKHPHEKAGYSKVGTKSKSGGDGSERTYKNRTSPWNK